MGGAERKWGALADDAGESPSVAPAPQPEPQEREDREHRQPVFIVGVGASAGGLEALTAFLKTLALDSMAIVIVQHLAPKHESLLPTLLSRWSEAKVTSVEDGMPVEPGRIYVIPPNADLAILQGVLHLMAPPSEGTRGPHLPIDYFFRSLAEDQGSRSIGIVLSGTGSDGTFGLQAIKEAGGITFAQEPSSAKYDGMPRSAIDSGWADFTLAPEEIANELQRIRNHPYLTRKRAGLAAGPGERQQAHRPHAVGLRQRSHLLQADDDGPPHRAADGTAEGRVAVGLREVRPEQPRRAAPPVQGHADQRDQLLPRSRSRSRR